MFKALKRLFRREFVHVEQTITPMTDEQRKHFDAAFAKMDEAFKELDKLRKAQQEKK